MGMGVWREGGREWVSRKSVCIEMWVWLDVVIVHVLTCDLIAMM